MNKQKAYIIEDNALNRASLEDVLLANNFEIVGSKATAESAWEELQHIVTDIVLIDIHLAGEKNGVWLAEQIRSKLELPFIYLTAYGDAKTIEEIRNTKPNGYLMKPYNTPTLLTTIDIAIDSYASSIADENSTIFVKDRYDRVKLKISDINFIKSDGNYITIFLEYNKYLVRGKLLDFYKKLPHKTFLQVHQRHVINTKKISLIGKTSVTINNEEITVSKKYRHLLDDLIETF